MTKDRFDARAVHALLRQCEQKEAEEANDYMRGIRWHTLLTVSQVTGHLLAMDNTCYSEPDEAEHLFVTLPYMLKGRVEEHQPLVVLLGEHGQCKADRSPIRIPVPETLLSVFRGFNVRGVYSTRYDQMLGVEQYCLEVAPTMFPA